jgi:N6-adenosine-specific RNA methylase IME4
MDFPTKKYRTIVADPPWEYGSWGKGSEKCACAKSKCNVDTPIPYKTMSITAIKDLPISTIADDNCELYLWTTQKYLPSAFNIIDFWGFKYCQILTWCKTPMGTGQGGLFCPTTEFLILGRKGKMPINKGRHNSTWWNIKRTNKHSKKPEFFQDIIEMVSNKPRIELFARRNREGWDCWGDEI